MSENTGGYPEPEHPHEHSHPMGERGDSGPDGVQEQLRRGGWGCVVLVVVFLGLMVWLFSDMGENVSFTDQDSDLYSAQHIYSGVPVPNFSTSDAQRLSRALSESAQTYDMCFGWSLKDGVTGEVQYGSSHGPDVRATSCPRWAEVRVAVGYTSASSPNYDAAIISVAASDDFPQASGITRQEFAELGIDADALIADPVSATGHAALALPLLLIQEGALQPPEKPQGKVGPSNPPTSLPADDGADFPVGTVVLLGLLGLGGVTAVVLGVRARRRE